MTRSAGSRKQLVLLEKHGPLALIVVSVSIPVILAFVSASRPLTPLESALMQGFSLIAGLYGSYVLGRRSSVHAARELIKPHARSAFRRVVTLYNSLSRLAFSIERARAAEEQASPPITPLDTLEAIVMEQLATADDAMEDWRDIVPEDVKELEARIQRDPPAIAVDKRT